MNRRSLLRSFVATTFLVSLGAFAAGATPAYRLTNLSALGMFDAAGVNGLGQVVGRTRTAGGRYVPVLFDGSRVKFLPRPFEWTPMRIDNAGSIVGLQHDELSTQVIGYGAGAFSVLSQPMPPMGPNTWYVAADATGRALANTAACAPPCAGHAVLYGPQGATDLGTLGGRHNLASAMNGLGHVVGWSQAATGARFTGYIHRNGQLSPIPAFMPNPPVRTEIISSANGINDRDQVVGWSLTGLASNGVTHGRAYLWDAGVMKDLGTLGGNDSSAVSINNAGDIIGYAGTVAGGDAADLSSAAFLHRGGIMYNLDSLLVPGGGAGWKIVEVITINDEGFILGWATAPGSATPTNVVLSPVQ
ncbi:hypothetical protein [Ideonella sp. BN130291]|uniref:hypothetical protein n=1 Tax=Ideonella sp. BN130291 TaxID=3112940 RepID=UPI002E273982|nr:hypothetical protein [Ideonella sp. BN130291]